MKKFELKCSDTLLIKNVCQTYQSESRASQVSGGYVPTALTTYILENVPDDYYLCSYWQKCKLNPLSQYIILF